MKTSFNAFFILLMLSLSTINAQEWSPEQKEVIEFFNDYTKISLHGDIDEVMSYFHTDFSAWVYSMTEETKPLDRDATQKTLEDFSQNFKTVAFEIKPVAIYILEDIAIAHVDFTETLIDTEGVEHHMRGPWTNTLLKQDKGWVFLCWTWIYL